MPDRLLATVQEFCRCNQDGRGLTVAARLDVERTLKHIRSAERKTEIRGVLAHRARKLLKSLQHNDRFELTIEQARSFAGEVQREGKRKARQAPVCDAQEFSCGTVRRVDIRLSRVVSISDLIKLGKRLDLCVAHMDAVGRRYHTELRRKKAEFWALGTAVGPIALLSIEEHEGMREVSEFQGRNGGRPRVVDPTGVNRILPGPLLRNVLRRLHADASNQEHFSRVGAFRSLLPAPMRRRYRDVIAEGHCYRVWRCPGEVIVGRVRTGDRPAVVQWSRFVRCELPAGTRGRDKRERKRREWQQGAWHAGAIDVERFLELLARSPALYDAFRGTQE